jgi:hypothetical protein
LSAVFAITPQSQRQARDAEAAHLEAVLKVNGAKALRLSHVAQMLRQSNSSEVQGVELKVNAGEEPHIWLDLSHRITMEPDAKTYRLTALSTDKVDVLLETENLETLLKNVQRVLAHHKVRQTWAIRESSRSAGDWNVATLVYVWATGVVAGGQVWHCYLSI